MERIECHHGLLCILKTKTKPGKGYGRSVYVCQEKKAKKCDFKEIINIPLERCRSHGGYVSYRVLRDEDGQPYIFYHCDKEEDGEWCGSWQVTNNEDSLIDDVENVDPEEVVEKVEHDDLIRPVANETPLQEKYLDSNTSPCKPHPHEVVNETMDETTDAINRKDTDDNSDDEDDDRDDDRDCDGDGDSDGDGDCDGDGDGDSDSDRTHSDSGDGNGTHGDISVTGNIGARCDDINVDCSNNSDDDGDDVNSDDTGDSGDDNDYNPEQDAQSANVVSPVNTNQLLYRNVPRIISSDDENDNHDDKNDNHDNRNRRSQFSGTDSSTDSEDISSIVDNMVNPTALTNPTSTPTAVTNPTSTPTIINPTSTPTIINPISPSLIINPTRPQLDNVEIPNNPISINNNIYSNKPPSSIVTIDGDSDSEDDLKKKDFKLGTQWRKLIKQLADHQALIAKFGVNLPDGGASLRAQETQIKRRMIKLRGYVPKQQEIMESLNKPSYDSDGEEKIPVKQKIHSAAMHGAAKQLTYGAIQNLHSSLGTCPDEDTIEDTPKQLTVTLMDHQRKALSWLKWREDQIPRGGILADDMGLGKTLSMISLIIVQKDKQPIVERRVDDQLLSVKATLVVCPLTLLEMWDQEIRSRVRPHTLSVLIYHGAKRTKDYRDFQYYDVVITTYTIVSGEAADLVQKEKNKPVKRSSKDTLFRVRWNRIILDEAHAIRNPKSNQSIGCCGLQADHYWAMTGTPIQNKLEDFYTLIKFLRVSPFDDIRVWKETIAKRSTVGLQRLRMMVSTLVLRRTKEEMMELKLIDLPEKGLVVHEVKLNELDKKIYDVLFYEGKGFFKRYLAEQGEYVEQVNEENKSAELLERLPPNIARAVLAILRNMIKEDDMMERSSKGRTVLVLLLRLRQACSHLNLLCSALEKESYTDDLDVTLAMQAVTLNQNSEEGGNMSGSNIPFPFTKQVPSIKINAIIEQMNHIFSLPAEAGRPNKCIIVSQWTSMFDIVQHHLYENDISFTRIDGKVPTRDRQERVIMFNSLHSDPSVMLLSLQAGGVGLTLTGANHVFIIDLHWNPQLEQQAADRCHRVGQTRNVVIHRFLVTDTVEVGIQAIQQKKLQLARDVLSGADKSKRKANFGLTLADLKQLFEVS